MEIGQRIWVQKSTYWIQAEIIDIHTGKRPATQATPFWCIVDIITCCSKLQTEYTVQYTNGGTEKVESKRIFERLT